MRPGVPEGVEMRKRLGIVLGVGALLAGGVVSIALASEWHQIKTVNCPAPGAKTTAIFSAQIPSSTPANDWIHDWRNPNNPNAILYPICPGTTQTDHATRIAGSTRLDTIRDKVTISSAGAARDQRSGRASSTSVGVLFRVWAGNADIKVMEDLRYNDHTYTPTDGTVKVHKGKQLVFDVKIVNDGPDTANGIVVDDDLPPGFNLTGTKIVKGPAMITKPAADERGIAAFKPLKKGQSIVAQVYGFFKHPEQSAENWAVLNPLLFDSYQESNKQPDSSSLTMDVI